MNHYNPNAKNEDYKVGDIVTAICDTPSGNLKEGEKYKLVSKSTKNSKGMDAYFIESLDGENIDSRSGFSIGWFLPAEKQDSTVQRIGEEKILEKLPHWGMFS